MDRFLDDAQKTAYLRSFPNADSNLSFHKAELLDKGAFVGVFEGVDGVFHMASPLPMTAPADPEADLIAPTVKGAESAIRAAAKTKKPIKRVVLTSSNAAVRMKHVMLIPALRILSWQPTVIGSPNIISETLADW